MVMAQAGVRPPVNKMLLRGGTSVAITSHRFQRGSYGSRELEKPELN
jgi:hypothetical protein